jgi:hypothetical protein
MEHRPEIGSFAFDLKCLIAKRETLLKFFANFGYVVTNGSIMYCTRHVVAWRATCQSPIGSYRLLSGNVLTRGTLARGSH